MPCSRLYCRLRIADLAFGLSSLDFGNSQITLPFDGSCALKAQDQRPKTEGPLTRIPAPPTDLLSLRAAPAGNKQTTSRRTGCRSPKRRWLHRLSVLHRADYAANASGRVPPLLQSPFPRAPARVPVSVPSSECRTPVRPGPFVLRCNVSVD